MLTRKEIRKILNNLPKNVAIGIEDILDTIERQIPLTSQDYESYTTSRKTNYPTWKNRVQLELTDCKKKHLVIHDEVTHTYSFF